MKTERVRDIRVDVDGCGGDGRDTAAGDVKAAGKGALDPECVVRGAGCCENRGNVDGIVGTGGPIDVADLTYLVDHLFFSGPEPPCFEEGDVNGDGSLNVADLTCLVDYLFFGVQCIEPCP